MPQKSLEALKRKKRQNRQEKMGSWVDDRRKLTGEKASHWQGGRIDRNGYIKIYSPNHPNCNKQGYYAEHRLIMEKKLGRLLDKKEVIHHKNGNTKDNRISNLVLFNNNADHLRYHGEIGWGKNKTK